MRRGLLIILTFVLTLSVAPSALAQMSAEERAKVWFKEHDRDHDGYLTADEVKGHFPFIEQNFAQVDVDHDGRISPAELMQLRIKQQTAKSAR